MGRWLTYTAHLLDRTKSGPCSAPPCAIKPNDVKHYALILFGYLCVLGLLAQPEFERAQGTGVPTTHIGEACIDVP